MYSIALTGNGDYDRAFAIFTDGLAFAKKVGDEVYHLRIMNFLGWLYLECGDFDLVVDVNRQPAQGARLRGDPETIANAELNLGDALTARGELSAAGVQLATQSKSRKYLVKGWRLKAEIFLACRRQQEAEAALNEALRLAKLINNPTQLWKTHLAAGDLYNETGRPEEARNAFHAAGDVIDHVKDRLENEKLRRSLENFPWHQSAGGRRRLINLISFGACFSLRIRHLFRISSLRFGQVVLNEDSIRRNDSLSRDQVVITL
jgi:tetratricopeptide (TPR) repeat protein